MLFRYRKPIVFADGLEKPIFKNFLGWLAKKESIGQDPARVWYFRAANIFARKTPLSIIERKEADERLDQSGTQPSRQRMIEIKIFILCVPFVASKQLVATIASKKCSNTMIASE